MANTGHIIDLINRFRKGECSPAEESELVEWRNLDPENEAFFQTMTDDEKFGAYVGEELRRKKRVWEKILSKAPELSRADNRAIRRKMVISKPLAAAAIVLLLLASTWYYTRRQTAHPQPIPQQQLAGDLPAGGDKAILTLTGGRRIVLDSAAAGTIAEQGNTKISKDAEGSLIYSPGGRVEAGQPNSLSTPRGGQFHLTLPDGSRIWLNAATKLDYPAAFGEKERLVSLSGEAYFEVAQDAGRPFRVRINDRATVEVLGTHFNIKAYADEPEMATTLLEGKINFIPPGSSGSGPGRVLTPGQQALLSSTNRLSVADHTDLENTIAWKNGMTSFYKAGVKEIMRAVSRWYNVDIEYRGNLPDKRFGGGILRSANLSELLKVMDMNGIHCRLEGRKIIVSGN